MTTSFFFLNLMFFNPNALFLFFYVTVISKPTNLIWESQKGIRKNTAGTNKTSAGASNFAAKQNPGASVANNESVCSSEKRRNAESASAKSDSVISPVRTIASYAGFRITGPFKSERKREIRKSAHAAEFVAQLGVRDRSAKSNRRQRREQVTPGIQISDSRRNGRSVKFVEAKDSQRKIVVVAHGSVDHAEALGAKSYDAEGFHAIRRAAYSFKPFRFSKIPSIQSEGWYVFA